MTDSGNQHMQQRTTLIFNHDIIIFPLPRFAPPWFESLQQEIHLSHNLIDRRAAEQLLKAVASASSQGRPTYPPQYDYRHRECRCFPLWLRLESNCISRPEVLLSPEWLKSLADLRESCGFEVSSTTPIICDAPPKSRCKSGTCPFQADTCGPVVHLPHIRFQTPVAPTRKQAWPAAASSEGTGGPSLVGSRPARLASPEPPRRGGSARDLSPLSRLRATRPDAVPADPCPSSTALGAAVLSSAAAAAPGDSQARTSFQRKRRLNLRAEAAPFSPPAGEDWRDVQDGNDWLPEGWGTQASAGDWPPGWGVPAARSRDADSSASEPAGRDQPGQPRAGLSSAAAWLGPEDGDPGDEGAAPQEASRPLAGRHGRRRARGSARSQGGLEDAARSRAAQGSDSDEEVHFGAGTARPLLTIV